MDENFVSAGSNEEYLSPTINGDGKYEYKDDEGTAVVVEGWQEAPESDDPNKTDDFEEIYLFPEQIEETAYQYYNKSGEIFADWEVLPAPQSTESVLSPETSSTWLIDWEIAAGDHYTSNEKIPIADSKSEIYLSIEVSSADDLYLGCFDSIAQTYTWLKPPVAGDLNLKLTVNSENPITVALKNDGKGTAEFVGQYSLNPIL